MGASPRVAGMSGDVWEQSGCSRDWQSECRGALVPRTTAGGFPDVMCEKHLTEMEGTLRDIAFRYPEIHHSEGCGCYGCSDGSW